MNATIRIAVVALLGLYLVSGYASGQLGALTKQDEKANELKKLQGNWKAVETIDSGKKLDHNDDSIFSITDDKLQIAEGKKPALVFSITLDPSKEPKSIDLSLRGRTAKGIYELNGDTLRFCLAQPGKDRPTVFASQAGDDQRLVSLQRIKTGK